jgi:hypothetical protein
MLLSQLTQKIVAGCITGPVSLCPDSMASIAGIMRQAGHHDGGDTLCCDTFTGQPSDSLSTPDTAATIPAFLEQRVSHQRQIHTRGATVSQIVLGKQATPIPQDAENKYKSEMV